MHLIRLDHVNLQTEHLAQLRAFYVEVIGLHRGARPPFSDTGEWLYCGNVPVVHLVESPHVGRGDPAEGLRLSHFAFTAWGMRELLERLRGANIPYRLGTVPGSEVRQVSLRDPDGNALHVDFPSDEPGI